MLMGDETENPQHFLSRDNGKQMLLLGNSFSLVLMGNETKYPRDFLSRDNTKMPIL